MFFCYIFLVVSFFFHQSSIRLQLHTETKRSILNHSFYFLEACVFVYGDSLLANSHFDSVFNARTTKGVLMSQNNSEK